jgi:hypothetical protein
MLRPFCLSLGVLAGAAVAVLVWRGGLSEPLRQARASWSEEPPSVLVILVERKRDVAAIRATVDPGRILAHDESGFALEEGRVVAAGHDAVGTILTSAGWLDRPLEVFVPSSFTRGGELEPTEDRKGASGPSDDLGALMQKPTLSATEALSVLRALDGR